MSVWARGWDEDVDDVGTDSYHDEALERLRGAEDADELCQLLIKFRGEWKSSTSPAEAIELLQRFKGTTEVDESLVALLLCTYPRWGRVTGKLITQLEMSSLLGEASLDELAEAFLSEELGVVFPTRWLAREWIEIDLGAGATGSRVIEAGEDDLSEIVLTVEPPLRRWAVSRSLRRRPERLEELLDLAGRLPNVHGYAVVRGLLDAGGSLAQPERCRLVAKALGTGQGAVRLAALDLVCQDEGPEAARRRAAQDRDAKVRAWKPAPTGLTLPLS